MHNFTTVAALGVCLAAGSSVSLADIVSTFDVDHENWRVSDAAIPSEESQSNVPLHVEVRGNPGGFIRTPDGWEDNSFLVAPDKFTGNLGGFLGGALTVDRRFIAHGDGAGQVDFAADVTITGVGGSVTLGADLGVIDRVTWASHGTTLDEAGGWFHLDSGALATDAEILAVLANLEDMRLRGNLHDDGGEIGIDNVILTAVPAPGTLALAGLALCATRRRR